MKKIFLSILLATPILICNAQYLGIKGGVNFSNLYTDMADDENMRIGYHFGAYVNLPISDIFALQPEVLYSTKGSEATYNRDLGIFGTINGSATFKLDYIDIPILGVISLGEFAEIQIGPYIGLLANSSIEFDGDFEGNEELDSDNFKPLDYGVVGGLAFNFSALQIGARYNLGLQKIEDSNVADALLGDSKNVNIQVFAAIRIGNYD